MPRAVSSASISPWCSHRERLRPHRHQRRRLPRKQRHRWSCDAACRCRRRSGTRRARRPWRSRRCSGRRPRQGRSAGRASAGSAPGRRAAVSESRAPRQSGGARAGGRRGRGRRRVGGAGSACRPDSLPTPQPKRWRRSATLRGTRMGISSADPRRSPSASARSGRPRGLDRPAVQAGPAGRGRTRRPGGLGAIGGPAVIRRAGPRQSASRQRDQSTDTSVLDSAPFALNGQPTAKPDYLQQRFGAHARWSTRFRSCSTAARTFFFFNYTGNHSSNPYDVYSTVPTLAERGGDFSALAPRSSIRRRGSRSQQPDPRLAAQSVLAGTLLNLVPLPNQTGDTQNFPHRDDDHQSARRHQPPARAHLRGAAAGSAGAGRSAAAAGGGRGGLGGGRAGSSNLNISVHFRHSDNSNPNPFPTLGGSTTISAWDMPVGYSFTKGGDAAQRPFRLQSSAIRRRPISTRSIRTSRARPDLGVASDPFDWGAPNLSFSTFSSVRDVTPSPRTDQTISIGDTVTKIARQAHGARRRRLSRHPFRQPHRRRTRAAASSSPAVYAASISPTSCSAFRSRRAVQFGPGSRAVSDRIRGICSCRTTGAPPTR